MTSIYENQHYVVIVGDSVHSESTAKIYQVVNRETSVVETESSVLVSAMMHADSFSKELQNYNSDKGGRGEILTLQ